ncbi:Dedicator of cytokinesis protein 4 [Saguinus oedipus]|uniref:Dedicator of cytokinesis protein 4 n=1 Tax=Saguinus oedipus TaxID=9490 RepID=A0ABQ9UIR1_SAGOE|nr:Dedicator of cytokinesis protein 4 [Saguinus oedipus]
MQCHLPNTRGAFTGTPCRVEKLENKDSCGIAYISLRKHTVAAKSKHPGSVRPVQLRMLFNHIGDGALPRSDPNLSAPEKAVNPTPSSWSLDSGKEAKNMSDSGKLISPPVPPRPTQTALQ